MESPYFRNLRSTAGLDYRTPRLVLEEAAALLLRIFPLRGCISPTGRHCYLWGARSRANAYKGVDTKGPRAGRDVSLPGKGLIWSAVSCRLCVGLMRLKI